MINSMAIGFGNCYC